MRQRIAGEDLAGAGSLKRLNHQQPDRPAAQHADPLAEPGLGEPDRVNGDPERLQHRRVERVETFGQRHELGLRDPDALRHRAVERRRPDEFDVRAEVGMPLVAPFALPAGPVGIDRDELPGLEVEFVNILAEIAAEFVARHEGRVNDRRADAAVFEIVEVAAAKADRGHLDQRLACAPIAQIEGRDARVIRTMEEEGSAHGDFGFAQENGTVARAAQGPRTFIHARTNQNSPLPVRDRGSPEPDFGWSRARRSRYS